MFFPCNVELDLNGVILGTGGRYCEVPGAINLMDTVIRGFY